MGEAAFLIVGIVAAWLFRDWLAGGVKSDYAY